MDVRKGVCSEANVRVKGNTIWQSFIYEELPDICYICGIVERTMEFDACAEIHGAKQLYGC